MEQWSVGVLENTLSLRVMVVENFQYSSTPLLQCSSNHLGYSMTSLNDF